MLFWTNQGVFSPSALLGVLLTLFSCCWSIRLFCYALFDTLFCSKIVFFPFYLVFGICWCIHTYLLIEIFSLYWNVLISLLFYPIKVSFFYFPSFASTFWFTSSSCIFYFICWVAFFFYSQYVPAFILCLILLADYRRFLICVSCRISHPGFEFLLVFFRGTPILSLTIWAPAYFSSFNSLMFFVDIGVNNSLFFFSFCLDCSAVLVN